MAISIREVDEYIEYARKNPKRISKEVRLLIKNIVRPTLRRSDIFFDEQTYYNCIRYCEQNYHKLFLFQKFILAFQFMYRDDIPIFYKTFILIARGNGKDNFIVPVANFFQTPLYGVKDYHIEIVANAEGQAKDTFKVAYDMLKDNPKFKGKFDVTKELITNRTTKSELKYNTSNASTKDGKRPGCLIFNEIHAYENYDQINVFESALGKVKHAREFIITTQGYTREGPLDDMLALCMDILETGDNPLGYFPYICRLESENEIDDPESWHKANPAMEYMPILAEQIRKDYLEQEKNANKRPEFLTKRMNLPARNEEQTVASWKDILRCCYEDIEKKIPRKTPETEGSMAVIGLDYADIRDFVSAGCLVKKEETYIWRQHTWICADSPFLKSIKFPIEQNMGMPGFEDYEIVPGPVVDVRIVVGWCVQQMTVFDVVKITMDNYRYTLFKLIFQEYGISIETRDNPEGIVRLIRKIGSAMGIIAPSMQAMFSEGRVDYGDSAIMRWYTNNVKVTEDKNGNKYFGKIEPKLRKTDGFMAFAAAMFSADLLEETIIYV